MKKLDHNLYRLAIYPSSAYKTGKWTFWGDFLGTGFIACRNRKYLLFEEAKIVIKKIGLKNCKEWRRYCKSGKKPNGIPVVPDVVYKNEGWESWGDFLGTDYICVRKRRYVLYKQAKVFSRKLKLKTLKEWQEYCKLGRKPKDIPASPQKVYRNKGWKNWGDFLGTGHTSTCQEYYLTFRRAKIFVIRLKLKSVKEWKEYCKSGKRPDNIPSNPDKYYKNKGWKTWGDFLGTNCIASKKRKYRSYNKAKLFVRKLKLGNIKEWNKYCTLGGKPRDIPSTSHVIYKDKGWQGWKDFLGRERYKPFSELRKFVRKLKLQNHKKWLKYCKSGKKPDNVPVSPHTVYKNKGWISWPDFLGKL